MKHDESLTSETPEEFAADQEPEPAPSGAPPVLHCNP